MFGALPDDLRRPVELIGLIHLLLGARTDEPVGELPDAGALTAAIEREEHVETIRPDGTCRIFAMPVLPLRPDDASALAEGVSP